MRASKQRAEAETKASIGRRSHDTEDVELEHRRKRKMNNENTPQMLSEKTVS